MLERLNFRIVPVGDGFALFDGDTGASVGDAARARPAGWRAWLLERRPDPLEVREPPDGSLVFALAFPARAGVVAELADGQGALVWRYRRARQGVAVGPGRHGAGARVSGDRARTRFTVAGADGRWGGFTRGPECRVELAPRVEPRPFDKMLVVGAALLLGCA